MKQFPLELRPLGRTGLGVSPLGLGCVTFGREIDHASARAVLLRAAESGINFCDTSEAYADGVSETVLGSLLDELGLRGRMLVCTKVRDELTRDRIPQAAEASLRRLSTERLDVYMIHRFDPTTPLEESLGAMDALVRAGKVRHIGCSNFSAAQLTAALDLQRQAGWRPFEVIQPAYSLVAREAEAELFPLCRREGIGVVTYSPLAAGFLTGKYDRAGNVPPGSRFDVKPGHRRLYFTEEAFAVLDRLRTLAQRTGVPMEALALRWAFVQPAIASFLIGARSPAQIDQALAAWQQRGLPPELPAEFPPA